MSGATAELVRLIDLSLGNQPSGAVNFNYLHTLMHAIVGRLGSIEHAYLADGAVDGLILPATGEIAGGGAGTAGGGVDASAGGGRAGERTTTAAGVGGREMKTGEPSGTEGKEGAVTSGTSQEPGKAEEAVDGTGEVTRKEPSLPPPGTGGDDLSESRIPSSGRASRAGQHSSSDFYQRQKSTFVTAANDLGALERKLQELESRLNAMDTLPELLERKSSDMGATPIKDRWNFTNLTKRLSAAEDGLEQNSTLVDDLLGEVQNIKSAVTGCENSLSQLGDKLSGEIAGIMEQLKALDDLKMAAAKDSMGEAAAAMLSELQSKIDSLQSELNNVKGAVDSLDLSPFATRAEVEEQSQQSSELGGRMESVEGDMGRLTEQIEQLKTTKLNIADMASLMPTGDSEEMAALLPRLMELQSRLDQVEGELGKATALPPDVMDQISAMQKAIDKLTADLASLSSQIGGSSEERARLEELGSEVAQMRERMAEVDRAVGALTDAVSTLRDSAAPADEESDVKYADLDSVTALQELVTQQQQDQERLIGTVAHVSNEVEINKEHIKALYSSADELRATKADREQLEVEVREKADRAALEGKASREWVDSTFERLDQKIREARDQMMGQEEALRSAVHRLDEDVDTKLDKGELEPLKDYFDKKFARVKTAPAEREEALVEDAAGFRK
ncbi:Glutamine-rich protein 2 [Geodia barretti]|nr:Glutamine-rich protein 2 [Geodia barretti]